MAKIKLIVGGIDYFINTDEEESYMQEVGHEVNKRLETLSKSNSFLSTTMAAVLTALDFADECKKAATDAENLRMQLKGYVEDAASARLEADEARREIERLNREMQVLRSRVTNQ